MGLAGIGLLGVFDDLLRRHSVQEFRLAGGCLLTLGLNHGVEKIGYLSVASA